MEALAAARPTRDVGEFIAGVVKQESMPVAGGATATALPDSDQLKQYFAGHVDPIMRRLMTDLIVEQPDDVSQWLVERCADVKDLVSDAKPGAGAGAGTAAGAGGDKARSGAVTRGALIGGSYWVVTVTVGTDDVHVRAYDPAASTVMVTELPVDTPGLTDSIRADGKLTALLAKLHIVKDEFGTPQLQYSA